VAEIDSAYFGGYIKPTNRVEDRIDRRLAANQNGKRKAVVVIRERDGSTIPGVFPSESHALAFIQSRVAKGTVIHADESRNWDVLNGCPRFRCTACRKSFSITGATLFHSHKLPLRGYLAAIAVFCNEVKGKSALALSRDLGLSYKSAFVLQHKLREAMAEEIKGRVPARHLHSIKLLPRQTQIRPTAPPPPSRASGFVL
jgi:transposase-like protein